VLRRLAGWVTSAAVLAACGLALRGRMAAIGASGGLPSVRPMAIAVVANTAANGVVVTAWRRVLRAAGELIDTRAAAWVWSVSQLARYMVGAAQVGGRAVAGRRYGLSATAGALTTLVEVAWQAAITATLVLATAPWWLPGASGLAWLAWIGALPAAVLAVGLIRPDLLLRVVAAMLGWRPLERLTGRRMADGQGVGGSPPTVQGAGGSPPTVQGVGGSPPTWLDRVRLPRADAARVTVLYALNSGLRLGAFLSLFVAVSGSLGLGGLRAVGAYALGQLIGRLAVFAPGGLGPREGATALVVAPAIGGGPALVLVASVRLAEILGEAAFAVLARLARPSPAPPSEGGQSPGCSPTATGRSRTRTRAG
jgi:glycosyltransferase 2 family protein